MKWVEYSLETLRFFKVYYHSPSLNQNQLWDYCRYQCISLFTTQHLLNSHFFRHLFQVRSQLQTAIMSSSTTRHLPLLFISKSVSKSLLSNSSNFGRQHKSPNIFMTAASRYDRTFSTCRRPLQSYSPDKLPETTVRSKRIPIPTFRKAEAYLDNIALQDHHGDYSYRGLFESSASFSKILMNELGGKMQERVAFLCPNSASYIITQWACSMSGQIGKHFAAPFILVTVSGYGNFCHRFSKKLCSFWKNAHTKVFEIILTRSWCTSKQLTLYSIFCTWNFGFCKNIDATYFETSYIQKSETATTFSFSL